MSRSIAVSLSLIILLLATLLASATVTNAHAAENSDKSLEQQKDGNDTASAFPSFTILLTDSLASIYRMFVALGISFVVAIVVGITAAAKPLASRIIIPVIDILQSVPILGFFPVAIAFFIALFNGSPVGVELAAIFLIFSSMVWNMIFSVYESVLLIPSDLQETSRAFRANPILLFRRLYLPAITPKLIYNSMMSWSGGWYFLTAAEIISLGSSTYTLPGLGSLLSASVSAGQYPLAFATLGMLVSVVLIVDFLFWRPLESFANRFKYEYSSSATAAESPAAAAARPAIPLPGALVINLARMSNARVAFPLTHLTDFMFRNPRQVIIIRKKSVAAMGKVAASAYNTEQAWFRPVHRWFDNKSNQRKLAHYRRLALSAIIALAALLIIVEGGTISRSFLGLYGMYTSLYDNAETSKVVSEIPVGLLLSYLRLAAAYLISVAWTIPVAVKIAKSKKFSRTMSVIQTFASIPATAFFPFMALLVNYIPGGLEFPSILLILTGMQWYMLFNLVGGVRSVSGDIEEAAKACRCTKSQYLRRVLFPSIYPSFITGSITAWGGGWNALIVSEYLVYGNKTYTVLGLGSILDNAAYNLGNTVLILVVVGVMVAVIVTINNLVWRRLYKKVTRKYSMSG
jgi:NitT/TauT family transport system permease protein